MQAEKARALTQQWRNRQPAERTEAVSRHHGSMRQALTNLIPDDAAAAVVLGDEHPVIAALVGRQLLVLSDDGVSADGHPIVRCDSAPIAGNAPPQVTVAAHVRGDFGPPVLRARWTWRFSTGRTIRFDTVMTSADGEAAGEFVRALADQVGWPLEGIAFDSDF